jgi:hypothetical protein
MVNQYYLNKTCLPLITNSSEEDISNGFFKHILSILTNVVSTHYKMLYSRHNFNEKYIFLQFHKS